MNLEQQLQKVLEQIPEICREKVAKEIRYFFDGDSAGKKLSVDVNIREGQSSKVLTKSTGNGNYYYYSVVPGYQIDVRYINWRDVPEHTQTMKFYVDIVPYAAEIA